MKIFLRSAETKIIIFLFLAFVLTANKAKAEVAEDSCLAMMMVTPDHFDPLLMHFSFTGNVPINSFQFLGSWDFGDGFTSTDSCPDHQYTQPGTYIVCLSFSICIGGGMSCHDDTCESITIGTMNIENTDGSLHTFYSYPNPVRNEFHIRSDSNKELEVKIRDVSGRLVLATMVNNDDAIDAATLAGGMYFMEVTDRVSTLVRRLNVRN